MCLGPTCIEPAPRKSHWRNYRSILAKAFWADLNEAVQVEGILQVQEDDNGQNPCSLAQHVLLSVVMGSESAQCVQSLVEEAVPEEERLPVLPAEAGASLFQSVAHLLSSGEKLTAEVSLHSGLVASGVVGE